MAKVRVYELAKDLGVTSKDVLNVLKDMGEFVRSASSPIEPLVERRLRQRLGSEPLMGRLDRRRQSVAKQPTPEAEWEWPGPDLYLPQNPRRGFRGGQRRSGPRRQMTEQMEATKWARYLFDDEAASDWKAGGIWEPELAWQCAQAGIPASVLSWRVDGRRVGERLAGGESPSSVLARLRSIGWEADAG